MALFFWVRDISCSISLMLREVFIVMRVWVGGWGLEEVKEVEVTKKKERGKQRSSRLSSHVSLRVLSPSILILLPLTDRGSPWLRGASEGGAVL